jgi:Zn-dependent peptidase ImmA (M78 family)
MVERLAEQILDFKGVEAPPVPSELAFDLVDTCVTISSLPLKSLHGALWCLKDEIIIFTNKTDTFAKKRVAIFHELFHAMCFYYNDMPVESNKDIRGAFIELIAGYFAISILMPEKLVAKEWEKTHDIEHFTNVFQVPRSYAIVRLRRLGLLQDGPEPA